MSEIGQAAVRLEHPKRVAQNAILVAREVDHAIRNDYTVLSGSGMFSISPFGLVEEAYRTAQTTCLGPRGTEDSRGRSRFANF
jgi:hypothetical protein